MFSTRLFGYDKGEVEDKFEGLLCKISLQQKDIDYLRKENKKLNSRLVREKYKQENQQIEK